MPLIALLCLLVALPMSESCQTTAPSQQNSIIIQDNFDQGGLDLSQWQVTRDGDFAEMVVDVCNVSYTATDYCLRLRANTIGTSDNTVKFLGVRNLRKIDFAKAKVISFDLDWNNQANGCYLTAGVYLCPVATDTNPASEPDWVAFEYIGVPPGEKARFQVARVSGGNLHLLYTEGWPDRQRTGRKIANQHVELIIDSSSLKVRENGEEIFSTENHDLNFTQAYLYLQMSSHSNYPSREVYFDNVLVKGVALQK